MHDIIRQKLLDIETKENIKILYAAESGSRAWGFASPDSDYDVRFIYARPKEFYLRLDKTSDVIEWQLDDIYDINGWDIQKALRLLHRSNPTLFEWNNSPIVYKMTDEWNDLRKEISRCFLIKTGLYHYLNTAKSNYREFLKTDIVKLKKYFYVLRPILACKWILLYKCPPPMLFLDLVEAVLEDDMKPLIFELYNKKTTSPEMGEGSRIDRINEYIEGNIVAINEKVKALPDSENIDWGSLNSLFLSIIK